MCSFRHTKHFRATRIFNLLRCRSRFVNFLVINDDYELESKNKFLLLLWGGVIEKAARPLNRCEYIFDVITELTKLNNEFYLIFKRILWYFPLKYDSDPYIDMMFNQILPDYVEGLIVVTSANKLSGHLNVEFFFCRKYSINFNAFKS